MYGGASYGDGAIGDYETNKKKHGAVALIGLIWCGIWIWVLSAGIAYMN